MPEMNCSNKRNKKPWPLGRVFFIFPTSKYFSNYFLSLKFSVFFGLILFGAFFLRVLNLNYNAPFSDEAIYIVLGKLGLFQWDWTSFVAGNWMAGSLFAYPPLTAMAYTTLGIAGSRLLNVFFGVLAVKTIANIAGLLSPPQIRPRAALITAFIIATAALSVATSRLATYDMPSFYFLFQSLYCILKAFFTPKKLLGKWYFLAVLNLFLAAMMKIISLAYWPLIISIAVYDFYVHRQAVKHFFWWRYFFVPFVIMLILYLSLQTHGILIYFQSHGAAEHILWRDIFNGVKPYLLLLLPLWLIGSFALLFRRALALWAWLTLSAIWIILLHFGAHRLSTFDKHLFFTEGFVALLCGIGLSRLFPLRPTSRQIILPSVLLALVVSLINWNQSRLCLRSNLA